MGARKTSGADLPAMRPALTPEARENQMISLAMDLVEKRIREGTASSAETTHFLKLATSKTMLEKQKLEEENCCGQRQRRSMQRRTTKSCTGKCSRL